MSGRPEPPSGRSPGVTESHSYRAGDGEVPEPGREYSLFGYRAGRAISSTSEYCDHREYHVRRGLKGITQRGPFHHSAPEIVPRFPAGESSSRVAEGLEVVDGGPEPGGVAGHCKRHFTIASSVGVEGWCSLPTDGQGRRGVFPSDGEPIRGSLDGSLNESAGGGTGPCSRWSPRGARRGLPRDPRSV